ncbi:hypothetical protein PENSPDRAFT_653202 [Peniophora sp. CONT]|nr:hypothetical protein PENSPDRAFT_653202 [Peniophora sp. CONT]
MPCPTPFLIHMCMQSGTAPAPGTFVCWTQGPIVNGIVTLSDIIDDARTYEAKMQFAEAMPSPNIPLRCKTRNGAQFVLETVQNLPGPDHWLCGLPASKTFPVVMVSFALFEARYGHPPYTPDAVKNKLSSGES